MVAATAAKGNKAVAIVVAALRSFPVACTLGAALGVAAIVLSTTQALGVGLMMAALGIIVGVVGVLTAAVIRTFQVLTKHVARNNFGICTGLRTGSSSQPGFTEWLSAKLDDLASTSVDGPLTFGQLWTGSASSADVAPRQREVDLRLVTTCLSESQPFELPMTQGRYYFDADEWAQLFPGAVLQHMLANARKSEDSGENIRLANHKPPLTRMPLAHDLPVIVATRMSLSFPLLISAIPMWTVDRRTDRLVKVWFTDGGLCNNFPVQMFDAALPTRPTFAINLGRFGNDADQARDENENVRYAKDNRSGIAPRVAAIPHVGLGAIVGFAGQAFNAARNWSDVVQLDQPGYRDRIVEVLQTKEQGGMNLDMSGPTIDRLARRGEAAAAAMVDQFGSAHYRDSFTGWDNHRWIRYRATLAALPDWLTSFRRGTEALAMSLDKAPSLSMSAGEQTLAAVLTDRLVSVAEELDAADPEQVHGLTHSPRPPTVLRRVPEL